MADLVLTVQAKSQEAAESMLARACKEFGLRPLYSGRALDMPARGGRFMARAELPEQDERTED